MPNNAGREVLIRCVCGMHYRIRNAKAGGQTTCPECGSLVQVTEADLETEFSRDGLICLHEDTTEARDAVLASKDEVTMAGKGSRPGVTGRVKFTSEDALLTEAISGRSHAAATNTSAVIEGTIAEQTSRTFVADLMASFWLAGSRKNAIHLCATAASFALVIMMVLVIPWPFKFVAIIPLVIVMAFTIRYYWLVLKTTTKGEDEIPWFETDWDVYEDVLWPLFWLLWISGVCSLPALLLRWYFGVPETSPLFLTAMALGWLFWPVAVMSIAMGNTILFLRPDWLVRCIAAIGPSYVIAWLLIMGVLAGWNMLFTAPDIIGGIANPHWVINLLLWLTLPAAIAVLNLYFGYVLFRMLGLLFVHHRAKFPWKY